MTWKCEDCKQSTDNDQTGKVTSVCAHCGKPLCEQHGRELVEDAFGEVPDAKTNDNAAVHCADCQRAHHPNLGLTKA